MFCNEEELKSLYQIEDIRMAQNLIAKNIRCLACTCAEKGAYLFHESSITKISTNEVPVIDTTGAGDTFIGYYVAGIASKMNKKDNLNRASEAAAIATTKLGGAESIPRIN